MPVPVLRTGRSRSRRSRGSRYAILLSLSLLLAGLTPTVAAAPQPVSEPNREDWVVIERSAGQIAAVRTERLSAQEAKAIASPARIVAPNIELHIMENFEDCQGLNSREASDYQGTNDTYAYMQWALKRLRANAAWQAAESTRTITVAVIDTGVDYDHPDIAGVSFVHDYDVISGQSGRGAAYDDHGHGTHVTGIIAARKNNARGIAGLSSGAVRIMPIKVIDADGSGSLDDVIAGVDWAIDHGADLINMSLGGTVDGDADVLAAGRAVIGAALRAGIPVIAAAGNEGEYGNPPSFPALIEEATAVGATDADDTHAVFSTAGFYVDLSAPGEQIMAPVSAAYFAPRDDYACWSGTSMATPYVTAAAALLMATGTSVSGHQAVGALTETAVDRGRTGPDAAYGHGRIRPAAAARLVRQGDFEAFRAAMDIDQPGIDGPGEVRVYSDLPSSATCTLSLHYGSGSSGTLSLSACNDGLSTGATAYLSTLPEAGGEGGRLVEARLHSTALDGSQRTARAQLHVYTIDRTAPTWPAGIAQGWSLALEPLIHLDLPARDARGVTRYEVTGIEAGGGSAPMRESALPFVEAPATAGATVVVDAVAVDGSGNRSASTRIAVTAPDADATLSFDRGSRTIAHRFAFGGTMAGSDSVGARLTTTCDGTAMAVYGPRGAQYANLQIRLDGVVVATINPATLPAVEVFSAPIYRVSGLSDGPHSLEITNLGGAGRVRGAVVDAVGCRSGQIVDPATMSVVSPSDESAAARLSRLATLRTAALADTTLPVALRQRLQARPLRPQSSGVVHFGDVACRTARHCLSTSSHGLYESTNAGHRWSPLDAGHPDDSTIDCLPAPRGLCLTSNFYAMRLDRSVDGGQTWHSSDPSHLDWFWDAACASNGLCTSTGVVFAPLFHSRDGGLTWETDRPNGSLFEAQGIGTACGPSQCISSIDAMAVISTLDEQGDPVSSPDGEWFEDDLTLTCSSDEVCVGVGMSGGAYTTRDGGLTWSYRSAFAQGPTGVDCWTTDACVSVGFDRIHYRATLGSAWSQRYRWQPRNFDGYPGVAYASERVVIVGYGDGIYRSVDGGLSWRAIVVRP